MKFLIVEDILDTAESAVNELREQGHDVIVAESIEAAREVLDREPIDGVILDQQIPLHTGGSKAHADEVVELARGITEGEFEANGPLGFVWLTAYRVEGEADTIAGCLGTVRKAADPAKEVPRLFARTLEGYYNELPSEAIRDQVLLEVWIDDDGRYVACVPTWREEPFVYDDELIPSWLIVALRASGGTSVYVKARANLRAQRHTQLELDDLKLLPDRQISEDELWDA